MKSKLTEDGYLLRKDASLLDIITAHNELSDSLARVCKVLNEWDEVRVDVVGKLYERIKRLEAKTNHIFLVEEKDDKQKEI